MDFPDYGPEIVGVSISLTLLATIFAAIRTYYRLRLHVFSWDDALILAAVVLTIAHAVVDCFSVYRWGYGRHKENLTPEQASAPGQNLGFWLAQIIYKLVIVLTKLSICLLYRRMFERGGRAFKIALHTVMGLVVTYYTASILATIFQCTPVQKVWIKTLPGTCTNTTVFFYANAAFNIATDIAIILLPVPIVVSLHLPLRQKLVLSFVFAVGLIATATSIIRTTTLNVSLQSTDLTWEIGSSVLWSSAEMNTAILCACIPTLKSLLQTLFPRLFHGATSRSNGGPRSTAAGGGTGAYGNMRSLRASTYSGPGKGSVKLGSTSTASRLSRSRFSARLPPLPFEAIEKRLQNGKGDNNKELGVIVGEEESDEEEVYILQGTDDSTLRAAKDGVAIVKSMDVEITYEDGDEGDVEKGRGGKKEREEEMRRVREGTRESWGSERSWGNGSRKGSGGGVGKMF